MGALFIFFTKSWVSTNYETRLSDLFTMTNIYIIYSWYCVLNFCALCCCGISRIMAWHRPGDKPSSESMMVSLLAHICVTQRQWINYNFLPYIFPYLSRVLPLLLSFEQFENDLYVNPFKAALNMTHLAFVVHRVPSISDASFVLVSKRNTH